MALTHHYVDPSLDSDNTGTGIGDPWGDLEYLLETGTPGSDGNQINIKAGTDEVLAAKLETAIALGTFTHTETNPLIIRGYTSVANDGGIGGISGNSTVQIFADATADYVHFVDMHLHSGPDSATYLVDLDNYVSFRNCEIGPTDGGGISADVYCDYTACYVHDIGQIYGINGGGAGIVERCYVDMTGDTGGTVAINVQNGATCEGNIVVVTGAQSGIRTAGSPVYVHNNSIYSTTGTGGGIACQNSAETSIRNNLIEGFSGVGGEGIKNGSASRLVYYEGNAFYNNTTNFEDNGLTNPIPVSGSDTDNETLTASPFTDAANGDFSPVDTGNVLEGSLPNVIGGGLI
jgi:hypothetical protein